MNQNTTTADSPISSPAYKRPRPTEEPTSQPKRLEEEFVPLYKAYRKARVSLAKAEHHYKTLTEYKTQQKIPKSFKVNIKPQVPNPSTKFIIDWETAASEFGHKLVSMNPFDKKGKILHRIRTCT